MDYLGRLSPGMVAGHRGLILGFLMIALCTAWNILGADAVGEGSLVLNIALLLPFVALVVFSCAARTRGRAPEPVHFRCVTPICSEAS